MNFAEIQQLVREPFFINWFLINLGFLLAGVLLGRMLFTKGKSKAAYKQAIDKANEEFAAEKKEFSNDVSAQLAELRNGIINSAQAYQKAIEVIGGHIGSTENFSALLLEQSTEEPKELEDDSINSESIETTAEKIPAGELINNTGEENLAQASA